jgi:gluconate 2-dehydrogenase gamma chain
VGRKTWGSFMNRREALRLLATASVLPMAAPNLLAMRKARVLLGALDAPRTLNEHQFATVKMMAEMILPKTNTPGATDVGATAFIDLILTEWYPAEERSVFLKGLDNVDVRSQALFARNFVDCAEPQQAEILVELGEKMLEEAQARGETSRHSRRAWRSSHTSFYPMLRSLTLTAYYTSEAGATQELQFDMVPGKFDGCVQIAAAPAAKEGASQQ